ncbi:AP2 domain transcription factor AP2VIIa-5 [Toxoplasma gondii TgCatPRC2]|uniref:AP2 domain transcription factor AP2VIIa-5 n=1 Tax=Toxoplasma gondii TgCatPRC2 TaxID=1130821 RepID=A0A151HAX1_TOXGO|nr:AP2 domain transcription factor AP2VIIa-5 [Toxoplasma gondii TgCatPRC2]
MLLVKKPQEVATAAKTGSSGSLCRTESARSEEETSSCIYVGDLACRSSSLTEEPSSEGSVSGTAMREEGRGRKSVSCLSAEAGGELQNVPLLCKPGGTLPPGLPTHMSAACSKQEDCAAAANGQGKENLFEKDSSWVSLPRSQPRPSSPVSPFPSASVTQCAQHFSCSTASPSLCIDLTSASSPSSAPCLSSLPSYYPSSASPSSSPVAVCSPSPRTLTAVSTSQSSPASSATARDQQASSPVSGPQRAVLDSSLIADRDSEDREHAADSGCDRSSTSSSCSMRPQCQRDCAGTHTASSGSVRCDGTGDSQDWTAKSCSPSLIFSSLRSSSRSTPQALSGSPTDGSVLRASRAASTLPVPPSPVSSSLCQPLASSFSSSSPSQDSSLGTSSRSLQSACDSGRSVTLEQPSGGVRPGSVSEVASDTRVHGRTSSRCDGDVPEHETTPRVGSNGDKEDDPSEDKVSASISSLSGDTHPSPVSSDLQLQLRTEKASLVRSETASDVSACSCTPDSLLRRNDSCDSSVPTLPASAQHTGEVCAAAHGACVVAACGERQAASRLGFPFSVDKTATMLPCLASSCGSQRVPGSEGEARLNDLTSAFELFRPHASAFPCTVAQQAEVYVQLLTGLVKLRASFWRSTTRSHAFSFHIFQIRNAKTDSDLGPYREIFEPLFSRLGLPLTHTPAVPHLAEWVLLKNLSSDKEVEEEQKGNLDSLMGDEHGQQDDHALRGFERGAASARKWSGGSRGHAKELASASQRRRSSSTRSPSPSLSDENDVIGSSPFSGEGLDGQRCSAFAPLQSDGERHVSPITELVKQDGPRSLGRALETVYEALDRLFISFKEAHDFCLTPAFPEAIFEPPQDAMALERVRVGHQPRTLSSSAFAAERLGLAPLSRLRSGSLGETERRCSTPIVGRGSGTVTASLSARLSSFFPQPYGKQSFSRSGGTPAALSHPDHGLRLFRYPGFTGRRDWRGEDLPVGSLSLHHHDAQLLSGEVPVSPASSAVSSVPPLASPQGHEMSSSFGVSPSLPIPHPPLSNPFQSEAGYLHASAGEGSAAGLAQAVSEVSSSQRALSGSTVLVAEGILSQSGRMTTRGAAAAIQAGINRDTETTERSVSGDGVFGEGRSIHSSLQDSVIGTAASNTGSSSSLDQGISQAHVSEGMMLLESKREKSGAGPMEASVPVSSGLPSVASCSEEGCLGSTNAAVCRLFDDAKQQDLSQTMGLLTPNLAKQGGGPGSVASACVANPILTSLHANGSPGIAGAGQPAAMLRQLSCQPRSHLSVVDPTSLALPVAGPPSGALAPVSPTDLTGQGTIFPVSSVDGAPPSRPLNTQRGSGAVSISSSASVPVSQPGGAPVSQETPSASSGDGLKTSVPPGSSEKDERPSGSAGTVSGTSGEVGGTKQGLSVFSSSSCATLPAGAPSLPLAISFTPLQLQQLQLHPSNVALFTNLSLPSSSTVLSQQTGTCVASPMFVAGGGNVSLSQLTGSVSGQNPACSAAFPLPSSPTGDPAANVFGSSQSQATNGLAINTSPGFLLQNLPGVSGGGNAAPSLRAQVTPSGQLFLSYSLSSGTTPGATSVSSTPVGGTPFGGVKCGTLNVPFIRMPSTTTAVSTPGAFGASRDTSEAGQSTGSESRGGLPSYQGSAPVGGAVPVVPGALAAAGSVLSAGARSVSFCEPRVHGGIERQGALAGPGALSAATVGPEDDTLCRASDGGMSQKGDARGPDDGQGTRDTATGSNSLSDPTSRSPFPLFQLFRNGWWATPIPPEDPPLDRDATEALLPFLPSFPAVVYDKEEHCFFSLWRMKDGLVQRRRCECAVLGVREAHRQAVQTVCRLTRRPPGVVYDCKSGKWSVCVTRHNGRHRASFSVKKFGFEGAHEKAMDWYEAKRVQLGLHDNPTCAEIVDFDAGVKANPAALLDIVRKAVDAAPPAQPVRAPPPVQKGETPLDAEDGREESNDQDKKNAGSAGGVDGGDTSAGPLAAAVRPPRNAASGLGANEAGSDSLPASGSASSNSSSASPPASSTAVSFSALKQDGETAAPGEGGNNPEKAAVRNEEDNAHVKQCESCSVNEKENFQAERGLHAPCNEQSANSAVTVSGDTGLQRGPERGTAQANDVEATRMETNTEPPVSVLSTSQGTAGVSAVCSVPRAFGGESTCHTTDVQPSTAASSSLPGSQTASRITSFTLLRHSQGMSSDRASPASPPALSAEATLSATVSLPDSGAGPEPIKSSLAMVVECGKVVTNNRDIFHAMELPVLKNLRESTGDLGRFATCIAGGDVQFTSCGYPALTEGARSGAKSSRGEESQSESGSACSVGLRDSLEERTSSHTAEVVAGQPTAACTIYDETTFDQDAQTQFPWSAVSRVGSPVKVILERSLTSGIPCGGNGRRQGSRGLNASNAPRARAADKSNANKENKEEGLQGNGKGNPGEEAGNTVEIKVECAPSSEVNICPTQALRAHHDADVFRSVVPESPNGRHHGRQDEEGHERSKLDCSPPTDREAASSVLLTDGDRACSGCADQVTPSAKPPTGRTTGGEENRASVSSCEGMATAIKGAGDAVRADPGARKRACEEDPMELKKRKCGTESLSSCLEVGEPATA